MTYRGKTRVSNHKMSRDFYFQNNYPFLEHQILLQTPIKSQNQNQNQTLFPLFNSTFSMSLKPSNSSENLMLPVSDPPKSHDADDKLFKGSAMTKRGAFAAVSYMSCAGNLSSLLSIPPRSFVVNFFQFSVTL